MHKTSEATRGLSAKPVDALRYASRSMNPYESTGMIISMIPPGARVLDIGCGTGSISSLVREVLDAEVVGVEPNWERAQAARERGLEVVHGEYDADIPNKHGTFDAVLFADVLEHLVDPVTLLEMVKGALSPGGRVLASIPNVGHWSVRRHVMMGRFDYEPTGIMDATHLRWFTRASVRRLFDAAGYDVDLLGAAAGGWMGEYRRTPLRYFGEVERSRILSKLCSAWPGLFAAQHVIAATPRDKNASGHERQSVAAKRPDASDAMPPSSG